MTRIEAVVFDLEGTVVDVESAHHQAHILSAKDIGLKLSLEDCFKLIGHFIGGPDEKVAQEIAQLAVQQGLSADPAYILERKKHHYQQVLVNFPIKPREGFLEFLTAIKSLGLKYAIGSLTSQEQASLLLEKSGLGRLFGYENIVLKEHVKNLKPAPDVWIETAKRVNVNPSAQLIFEDSPRGIQGAVKIGAYCIGMPVYNHQNIIQALTAAGAKKIFMSWKEINPSILINDINQEHYF